MKSLDRPLARIVHAAGAHRAPAARPEDERCGRRRRIAGAGWAALLLGSAAALPAVPAQSLADPGIPGFRFPENEATLVGWIYDLGHEGGALAPPVAFERLQLHGWGLWTALTAETALREGSRPLRVFETWPTPQALIDAAEAPNRLQRFQRTSPGAAVPAAADGAFAIAAEAVFGFVKYDPTAAEHIRRQRLLSTSALGGLLRGGNAQIPPFPSTAVAVKTVYQVMASAQRVGGRYSALKVWTGPPAVAQAWAPAQWRGCIWIDLEDGGLGRGAVDLVGAADGSSRTPETTYPLSSLIHFPLSAEQSAAFNRLPPGANSAPGDPAILVAMHVATREITRWTWQTYWWTPQPDAPPSPSSADIAALRPAALQGAARHYAMALGYEMTSPGQPVMGGHNVGLANYVYNPWLEARFGPSDLPDSLPGYDPAGQPAPNNCGVESNCMSCHSRANYAPPGLTTAPRYAGARYVDLADPQFAGTLQVDFLWTLAEDAR